MTGHGTVNGTFSTFVGTFKTATEYFEYCKKALLGIHNIKCPPYLRSEHLSLCRLIRDFTASHPSILEKVREVKTTATAVSIQCKDDSNINCLYDGEDHLIDTIGKMTAGAELSKEEIDMMDDYLESVSYQLERVHGLRVSKNTPNHVAFLVATVLILGAIIWLVTKKWRRRH